MSEIKVYKLTSENRLGLGGPMGSERVSINWERYYTDVDAAKQYAQLDYRKSVNSSYTAAESEIRWKRQGKHGWSSGDLSFVMYSIHPIKIY